MRIDHLAIWVEDIEKMRQFYQTYFEATCGENTLIKKRIMSLIFWVSEMGKPGLSWCIGRILLSFPGKEDLCTDGSLGNISGLCRCCEWIDWAFEKGRIYHCREPRTTGDGYYESAVLDPEGNYPGIVGIVFLSGSFFSKYSCKMRAWLCVDALEAYNKVTVGKDFILERNVFTASEWLNSSRYIEVNSSQCPLISLWNQLLSLGEGVISLAHSSYCKHSFFIPLGQSPVYQYPISITFFRIIIYPFDFDLRHVFFLFLLILTDKVSFRETIIGRVGREK